MKHRMLVASALALAFAGVPIVAIAGAPPAPVAVPTPEAPKTKADLAKFEKSLNKQSGDITIPGANAILHLGAKYYYLDPANARRVLVDLWGNPPSEAQGMLGMVLPADTSLADNVWGAVITFKDDGYVSDSDASTADYGKLLSDMRAAEPEGNAERAKAGYPAIHLMGWAQPPSYDKAAHSLIWARDLKFDGGTVDSLNYDVRMLGRKGVLSLNMISDMSHLAEVRAAAAEFGKSVEFQSGARYADYDSNVDKSAGYGLAGLVAGGVAIAAAKKLGLLALLAPFWKFIAIGFAALAAGARGFIGRLFGRKPASEDHDAGIS